MYANTEPMNKYTKQGIIPRFRPVYGGNYKPHKNAEMIENTSFLRSNDKEEKKPILLFRYQSWESWNLIHCQNKKPARYHRDSRSYYCIRHFQRRQNKEWIKTLALKRLILRTRALLQVAWVRWQLLRRALQEGLSCHCTDAACAWPASGRALAESNLEYDTANLLGKSLEEAVLSNKSRSHTEWKYTNCTNAHIYLQPCV